MYKKPLYISHKKIVEKGQQLTLTYADNDENKTYRKNIGDEGLIHKKNRRDERDKLKKGRSRELTTADGM